MLDQENIPLPKIDATLKIMYVLFDEIRGFVSL